MTQALPKERAREYESIFILHPDSQSNVVDNIAGRCQDIISKLNGKLLRAENWGRRKLAYPVKKNQKGIYIYLKYLGYQDLVHELERNFRTIDSIIKFLSVKIDEDVNPDARPVNESDISFVSTFIEVEAEEAVTEDVEGDNSDTLDGASDTPDAAIEDAADSKDDKDANDTPDAAIEDAADSKDDEDAADTNDAKDADNADDAEADDDSEEETEK